MIIYYTKHQDLTPLVQNFDEALANEPAIKAQAKDMARLASILTLEADKDFADFSSNDIRLEVIAAATALRKGHIQARLKELEQSIAQAEEQGSKEALKKLISEFDRLSRKLQAIE